MARDLTNILNEISSSLDQYEILERLNLSNEELCFLLRDEIMDNLHEFEDVYNTGIEEDY